ncbi:MAG: alpha/beta fold hydrolase [Planctomycetaceae bacterium]|nr:alpha/beta fold hydrolase [Planctomycetaceae bacterium]MBT4845013.1 alpha/beta fold hydrolase [Planctomycetaceae bacterium]MBT5126139.1 alpha/beta fold hydrolase [Planctomycetaceae bacterium]MBT5597700.1 alpha/beta fold hydrolase [Planctomycetaceae bacterium]MBT5885656.1 alpha/beta fold hydrolase [Planctomycetaceae bacterium]
MRDETTFFLPVVFLFAAVFPLRAEDLKNSGFEEEGGWQIITQGSNLQPAYANDASQTGQQSFAVSLAENTPTKKEDFAGIVQTVELTETNKGISFSIKDNYTGKTKSYHFMELLLDGEVIWEADVVSGDTKWKKVSLDLTRYLNEGKRKQIGRNEYQKETHYKITFRVFERKGVNRFGIKVWADNFKLLKETPTNPQNCEKKEIPPQLKDLLVYYDEADLFRPITKPEHFKKKRQQIIDGMLLGMGQLPQRPIHRSLEDFDIRVVNTQVRGRYIKQTIRFDAAKGEVVHAFLYEPLDKKPGEKRPGIVGMHPTGAAGKGCFESWPLCNFPIELAMLGYVVIVPDYPGFGDSRPYNFDSDRYDSGTIKGVFNHMTCVDLLQAHPDVDPDKIGAIGHSLGGHNAMFLAAFDERIKIAVSSCGWTPFEFYETTPGRIKTWALPTYMPPLEMLYKSDHRQFPFDFHEVAAAIAPRVFFSSSPTGDGVFPGWGPKTAAPSIKAFFNARGAEEAFQFHQPVAGHRFPWDVRQAAYRSMNDTFDYHFHGDLGLLTQREGAEAIPILKQALVDTNPKVRWAAADLLGTLNDQSGIEQMRKDLKTFSTGPKHLEHALEVAKVLATMGDVSGYELAADLATSGSSQGQRWRAAVVLAHIANTDRDILQTMGRNPVAVLKTMADHEKHEGVFFVFIDQVHKIMNDRSDMIDIFAIAKESKHHPTPPPGSRYRMAETFHSVAVRDKDKTWR